MCGIAGFWRTEGRIGDDPVANAVRMAETMRHRGPDDQGVWMSDDRRVVLSHRRLSILDTSSRGHQPMLSADGRQVIVYNGEIYNFLELRTDLEREGDRFVTGTDTEVILAAYRRYGVDCLSRFNGMFAFAIWDEEDRSLFLARDRFGVKPLLYYWQGGLFLFASEMKAIKAFDGLPALTLNVAAIRRYFYLTYLMSPDTVYKEIRQLDAGHFLVVKDGNIRCERWYDLAPSLLGKNRFRGRGDTGAPGNDGGSCSGPARVRRPLGRLPERRGRFEHRRRADGEKQPQAGQDLYRGVQRCPDLRRIRLCPGGGPPFRDGALGNPPLSAGWASRSSPMRSITSISRSGIPRASRRISSPAKPGMKSRWRCRGMAATRCSPDIRNIRRRRTSRTSG